MPKGGLKGDNFFRFPYKNALCSKKVYYKVSLCENCQRQSCKAFTGLLTVHKWFVGGRPIERTLCAQRRLPLQRQPMSPLTPPGSQYCESTFTNHSRFIKQRTSKNSDKRLNISAKTDLPCGFSARAELLVVFVFILCFYLYILLPSGVLNK